MQRLLVVGAGLAGSEAAWAAARLGVEVELCEMRPVVATPAHQTALFAELVCSNSLGSDLVDRAPGLLKHELRQLGSVIMACADKTAVPAGGALAVGREAFAQLVTEEVGNHPLIHVQRAEVQQIPSEGIVVLCTGPLTSPDLAREIAALAGEEHLYFYDAMAPIVTLESVDMRKAFRASRYGRGGDDYINCPMSQTEYEAFVGQLVDAETIPLRDFEREDRRFFEACLPIEVLARRGRDSLAYGPLKPVGLTDPRSGGRPYAVVQLRQDNLAGTLYNLVGFQTNLRYGEQKRVFSLIPGLESAEFVRYGQMHRNTFLNSPTVLDGTLMCRRRDGLFFGGQITGSEGYVASTATGLVAGTNAALTILGRQRLEFPPTTMIGSLCRYVSSASADGFQPMKPNFGMLPSLPARTRGKRQRHQMYAHRALRDLKDFVAGQELW